MDTNYCVVGLTLFTDEHMFLVAVDELWTSVFAEVQDQASFLHGGIDDDVIWHGLAGELAEERDGGRHLYMDFV